MPFQGPTFVRTQNFTRDRNAGPPDDTIQAERVDDEFNNLAAGLTTVALAAATADDRAKTAQATAIARSDAAQATAISIVRGGVDASYDTLKKMFDWVLNHLNEIYPRVTQAAPPGQLGMFFGPTPPAGWLHCNGGEASRAQYPALFAAIGTRYGAGNGSTTFNVPLCVNDFFRAAWSFGVGEKGAQSIQSHTHAASATATGSHNHTGLVTPSGQHAHSGITDTQGAHSHGISTNDNSDAGRSGVRAGRTAPFGVTQSTEADGLHAHNLIINPVGDHQHAIPMDGHHTHGIVVNATGDAETRPHFMAVLVCIKV